MARQKDHAVPGGAPLRANPAPRMALRIKHEPIEGSTHSAAQQSRVEETLRSPGQPLAGNLRSEMESHLGFDFSRVRIHTGEVAAASTRALGAQAYTSGTHIIFGQEQFDATASTGRQLLTHELAHVAQQGGRNGNPSVLDNPASPYETEAALAASTSRAIAPGTVVRATVAPGTIQRKISMRDVGKGEQSGFARVPELVTRLNGFSTGLTFAVTGGELTYTVKADGKLSNFDTQMQGFIDQAAILPLRFTNRSGLLGNKAAGFHDRVLADAWSSGYVDIDDLMASSDLGLQTVLVHFLQERTSTKNYEKRIGSTSLDTDAPGPGGAAAQAEFDSAHAKGIEAETQVLRDFFEDPTIKFIPGADSGNIARVFRNSRKDTIRSRVTGHHGKEQGVDAVSVEVVTKKDGVTHTPEEYKAILDADRAAAQAAVHNGPGGSKAAGGSTISP